MPACFSLLLLCMLCVAGMPSCAWRGGGNAGSGPAVQLSLREGAPPRIAVLPFADDGDTLQLAERVRQSFYSHAAPKKFRDVELRDVDTILEPFTTLPNYHWSDISPADLGRCLHADYLVYGTVMRTRRLFFVLYSQLALKVEIRLVEARSGRTVWETVAEEMLQNGDLPLHPLSVLPAAFRTGFGINDARLQDLIDRTGRELAGRMPEPQVKDAPCLTATIQLASFISPDKARVMAGELQRKGYEPRIQHVRINGVDWHRVLLGPYSRSDAEKARQELADGSAARPVLLYAP